MELKTFIKKLIPTNQICKRIKNDIMNLHILRFNKDQFIYGQSSSIYVSTPVHKITVKKTSDIIFFDPYVLNYVFLIDRDSS